MKRLLTFSLILVLVLCLCGCRGSLQKTEVQPVDAIVTNTWRSRAGNGITVEYGGARNDIVNAELYNRYNNNLGSTLTCYLIVRTYENETTKQLVYSSELGVD